jgi:hypothetical protein
MGGRRIIQTWDAETHEDVLLALIEHMSGVRRSGSECSLIASRRFQFEKKKNQLSRLWGTTRIIFGTGDPTFF